MRMKLEALNFFHFQIDIGVDLIVIHHAAFFEEVTVAVQCFLRFTQAAAHLWDRFGFFRWEIIKILVHGIARVGLVLDPVKARH